jgi:hypothetical protein
MRPEGELCKPKTQERKKIKTKNIVIRYDLCRRAWKNALKNTVEIADDFRVAEKARSHKTVTGAMALTIVPDTVRDHQRGIEPRSTIPLREPKPHSCEMRLFSPGSSRTEEVQGAAKPHPASLASGW